MGRELRKNKAKNNIQHRAVRRDRRVRERERERRKYRRKEATFGTEGRDTVPMPSTPSPIDRPLGLVVHSGGGASAAGKLSSTAEEKPKVRADRSIYDMQSDEAQGGSGGNNGNEAV